MERRAQRGSLQSQVWEKSIGQARAHTAMACWVRSSEMGRRTRPLAQLQALANAGLHAYTGPAVLKQPAAGAHGSSAPEGRRTEVPKATAGGPTSLRHHR